MKWLKRIGIALLVLLMLALVGKHFMLDVSPVPETSDFKLDLAAVRAAAMQGAGAQDGGAQDGGAQERGALPERLESLVVGSTNVPRLLAVAGGGTRSVTFTYTSFRLVYPDKQTIVIDTAMNKQIEDAMFPGSFFDQKAYDTMQEAMRGARYIVLTHEHPDHIGGLPTSPFLKELTPKMLFTAEQLHGPSVKESKFAPGALDSVKPLEYQGIHTVAPGLVLIRAPGHSVGSQLVYVKLANGAELLMIGDIGWDMANVEERVGKPWLASSLIKEDRPAVAAQLRTFYDLIHVQHDPIHVLVAHDSSQLKQYVASGLISEGFH